MAAKMLVLCRSRDDRNETDVETTQLVASH